jgi:hypothetical protein
LCNSGRIALLATMEIQKIRTDEWVKSGKSAFDRKD